MLRRPYLGEFEEIVLLAAARLGGEAYGMRVRREIEGRSGRAVSIGAPLGCSRRATRSDNRFASAPSPRSSGAVHED